MPVRRHRGKLSNRLRMVFKPYNIAVVEMKEDPGVSSQKLKQ